LVTGYVTVSDINATLDEATSLGGSVVMPKFSPTARPARAGRRSEASSA
jgi:predicted enzyme related to lactoylglutathione lyase